MVVNLPVHIFQSTSPMLFSWFSVQPCFAPVVMNLACRAFLQQQDSPVNTADLLPHLSFALNGWHFFIRYHLPCASYVHTSVAFSFASASFFSFQLSNALSECQHYTSRKICLLHSVLVSAHSQRSRSTSLYCTALHFCASYNLLEAFSFDSRDSKFSNRFLLWLFCSLETL